MGYTYLHSANWTLIRLCASSRMVIEIQISVGMLDTALRISTPRPDVFKLERKSRLPALRFGVDQCTLGAGVFSKVLRNIIACWR